MLHGKHYAVMIVSLSNSSFISSSAECWYEAAMKIDKLILPRRGMAIALCGLLLAGLASPLPVAANDCSAAAARAAAKHGAQRVLSVKATQTSQGTVCSVRIEIPARDGNRRRVITVQENG